MLSLLWSRLVIVQFCMPSSEDSDLYKMSNPRYLCLPVSNDQAVINVLLDVYRSVQQSAHQLSVELIHIHKLHTR